MWRSGHGDVNVQIRLFKSNDTKSLISCTCIGTISHFYFFFFLAVMWKKEPWCIKRLKKPNEKHVRWRARTTFSSFINVASTSLYNTVGKSSFKNMFAKIKNKEHGKRNAKQDLLQLIKPNLHVRRDVWLDGSYTRIKKKTKITSNTSMLTNCFLFFTYSKEEDTVE